MKQKDLLKKLKEMSKEAGMEFGLLRHGADHDQYRLGGHLVPVPRHKEISERTAEAILKAASKYIREEGQ